MFAVGLHSPYSNETRGNEMLQEIYFSDVDLSVTLNDDVRGYGMTHDQAHDIVHKCENDVARYLRFLHYDMSLFPSDKLAQAAECFIEDIRDDAEIDEAVRALRDDRDLYAYAEDYALALEKLPREMTEAQLAERYNPLGWFA